jgi:hypothetical protein
MPTRRAPPPAQVRRPGPPTMVTTLAVPCRTARCHHGPVQGGRRARPFRDQSTTAPSPEVGRILARASARARCPTTKDGKVTVATIRAFGLALAAALLLPRPVATSAQTFADPAPGWVRVVLRCDGPELVGGEARFHFHSFGGARVGPPREVAPPPLRCSPDEPTAEVSLLLAIPPIWHVYLTPSTASGTRARSAGSPGAGTPRPWARRASSEAAEEQPRAAGRPSPPRTSGNGTGPRRRRVRGRRTEAPPGPTRGPGPRTSGPMSPLAAGATGRPRARGRTHGSSPPSPSHPSWSGIAPLRTHERGFYRLRDWARSSIGRGMVAPCGRPGRGRGDIARFGTAPQGSSPSSAGQGVGPGRGEAHAESAWVPPDAGDVRRPPVRVRPALRDGDRVGRPELGAAALFRAMTRTMDPRRRRYSGSSPNIAVSSSFRSGSSLPMPRMK